MENEPLSNSSTPPGLHRFAILTASITFFLIFVGALVRSTGSGLSVPTWPLANGELIPPLKGGVRFEYGHRAVAGIVVILTLTLMLWVLGRERRRWVRGTAIVAFALVIVQAILGGLTVLLEIPLPIAIAHSGTAMAFFCVMVALAIFTGPWFERAPRLKEPPGRMPLAVLAGITTAVIYLQILIGALMRFLGAGLVIPDFPLSFGHLIPPFFDELIAVNFAHRCGAVVVTILVVWTVVRVTRFHAEQLRLRRLAEGLIVLLLIQITLGAVTIWSHRSVIPTSAHVAVGAAVLATGVALTVCACRLYGWPWTGERAAEMRAGDVVERKVTA